MSKFQITYKKFKIDESATSDVKILTSRSFTEILVPINFYTNDGTSSVVTQSIALGKTYAEKSKPSYSGHKFVGWYTQASGGVKVEQTDKVQYSIRDLYAQWEEASIIELEYIEGTGTQWLDTGHIPTANTMVQVKLCPTAVTGATLWGCCDANNHDWRLFNYNSQIYFDISPNRINGSTFSTNNIYEFELGNYYVKNVGASSNILTGTTVSGFSGKVNLMFLADFSQSSVQIAKGRLYYHKIYESNVLVQYLIPVKDSDGVACMYDNVSGNYFYSGGSSAFVAGPEK